MTPWTHDWLVLWKVYHSLYCWVFISTGVPLRVLMTRHLGLVSANRMWLASSAASAGFVLCMPFAALPAFALVSLAAGTKAVYSVFMAIPIALSVGIVGALVDAMLIRFLFKESVNRRTTVLSIAANTLNVSLAIGIVLAWELAYPVQMIAALDYCR